jgi:hypothetical protein
VRPAKLQMRKIALGAVGCMLVEAAKAMTREDRSGAKGHAVPAAGTGKDERVAHLSADGDGSCGPRTTRPSRGPKGTRCRSAT